MFDMNTVHTLAEKLDRNYITLKSAKSWVFSTYGKTVPGKTKDQFIREAATMARREFMANP